MATESSLAADYTAIKKGMQNKEDFEPTAKDTQPYTEWRHVQRTERLQRKGKKRTVDS